jgi:hypothetical protein
MVLPTTFSAARDTMKAFLRVFAGLVWGVLHGFDRLVFRGHLRQITTVQGMARYLHTHRILYKDFQDYVQGKTRQLIEASLDTARQQQRPVVYLPSSQISKEAEAAKIASRDGIRDGLICVFKCVEPCWTFDLHRNRERQELELRGKRSKCLFLYHYYQHPDFGALYGRVQTWFPFAMQIGLNGRAWLTRQLQREGLRYRRYDNKVTWVEDLPRAQQLLDAQRQENWPQRLEALRRLIHPCHPEHLEMPLAYYWSVFQSEWASDFLFHRPADVERVHAPLVRHAVLHFRSVEVLRFLGQKVPATGAVHGRFTKEILTTLKRRPEGVCLRHAVHGNSIKTYSGPGFLRVETTLNQPADFKVYRTRENDPEGPQDWRPLRKGVADLHRRATVCQAANDRYAEGLAARKDQTPLQEWTDPLCRRALAPGPNPQRRRVRALNPLSPEDAGLLEAILDPKFVVPGLRNRDLVPLLYPKPAADPQEKRRRSSRVTRLIRLLRAHGLLRKTPKSHCYQLSADARKRVTAVLAARQANTETLTDNAA